jgi:carboxymethylenebutenolidase
MVIVQHPSEPNDKEPPRYAKTIGFGKRRDAGTGYMAYSDRVGPGVIVLHEFFGLTQSFKSYADALCEAGFTVLAPDLYDGYIAPNVDEAGKKAKSLDDGIVMGRLAAAAAHLMDNWHPRLGVVGFSLGAGLAAQMAIEMSPEAVVTYYGAWEASDRWTAPLLAHWAENDEWEDAAYVKSYIADLESKGVDVDSYVYEGAGHWFANSDVPDAYKPGAAHLAFERTVDFLLHHLA